MRRAASAEPVLAMTQLQTLLPEWPVDLLPAIRAAIAAPDTRVVILDDDPTGTQTVQGLPVLTHWSEQALAEELRGDRPAFFILTNSRSLPESEAVALGAEIGIRLRRAMERTGVKAVVVSRSDSTLRGHFPAEVDAVAGALGTRGLPYLLIPFFLEGGRYTLDDIHYVREGEQLIPAADTPFARDAAFGFSHSNLRLWVEEKSGGAIPAAQVRSISLTDIRQGGVQAVVAKLLEVPPGRACIVNAISYRDMEVVVTALLEAEARGAAFLYRTAASFVRTRLGISPAAGLLAREALVADTAAGGLFVIGSYVPKTSRQVEVLCATTEVVPVEVDVPKVLEEATRSGEIARVAKEAGALLQAGRDVAIFTSRQLVCGQDAVASLRIGGIVSESLISVVRGITIQPRYLVAKGGITSSDIATRGLGVRRAEVLGQALAGVPAWRLGKESRYPDMTYIVFPGNVGDDDALTQIQRNLRGNA